MAVYLLHFSEPYKHARHYTGTSKNVQARLRQHAAGRGARLLAVVQAAGITWELARVWPGGRARERQLKRQGGASRHCPLCGITPRGEIPRNRDGSLSRSLTTDAQKQAAGVMTAAQQAAHSELRRGLLGGRSARPAERGPAPDDPWLGQLTGTLPLPARSADAE
jgi:predicted GIY-YIG superfamily endonuclease